MEIVVSNFQSEADRLLQLKEVTAARAKLMWHRYRFGMTSYEDALAVSAEASAAWRAESAHWDAARFDDFES